MRLDDMSLIGWFHTLFCFVAIWAGGQNLFRQKGTAGHKRVGQIYMASMVLQNVSALFVYEPHNLAGGRLSLDHFGVFHWLAIVTLAIVAIGYYAATRQLRPPFAYLHPTMMVLSYWLLLGGAINEVFVRIGALYALSNRAALAGIAQSVSTFVFFGVLAYFVGKVAAYRESEHSPAQAKAGGAVKPPSASSIAAA